MPRPKRCSRREHVPSFAVFAALPDIGEVHECVRAGCDNDLLGRREGRPQVHASRKAAIFSRAQQAPRAYGKVNRAQCGPNQEQNPPATTAEAPTPPPLPLVCHLHVAVVAQLVVDHGHVHRPLLAGVPHLLDELVPSEHGVGLAAEHARAERPATSALGTSDPLPRLPKELLLLPPLASWRPARGRPGRIVAAGARSGRARPPAGRSAGRSARRPRRVILASPAPRRGPRARRGVLATTRRGTARRGTSTRARHASSRSPQLPQPRAPIARD
mmetsp:Transcript_55509/g.159608  ORF Transcript_55509/g.159608 Transcript_55509/m.159608 type:complete len:273 (+) Transcript_55509:1153-1971(+)